MSSSDQLEDERTRAEEEAARSEEKADEARRLEEAAEARRKEEKYQQDLDDARNAANEAEDAARAA